MSYPDSRQIISLVTNYANEGNEFHLNKIVLFLTRNFDRTETGHPHDLPIEQKRTWLKEHDIFAIVKFRYVVKCVVVVSFFYLLTFLPYRQNPFGPLMFDFFVMLWADTMMTYKDGYAFMAMHMRKEEIITHWVKHLPKDALKLLPRSSENVVDFPMNFHNDAIKWVQQSRKEQGLQGRCREVIQSSLRCPQIDKLPLPRLIVDYLKELEPTMCFRVIKDIEPILTLDYFVEDFFTV